MLGSGERKTVPRIRLLPEVRADETLSNEAQAGKTAGGERRVERPGLLGAMFRPKHAGWRTGCHQDHLEPFSFCPPVTPAQAAELDQFGYTFLHNFIEPSLLNSLRERVAELFAEEGERAGSEFRQEPGALRLANVVDKGEVFRRAIVMPEVLACVGHVLGGDFKLSSLYVRSANPRNGTAQPLHVDMGAIADERGYWVCNTVWLLDDFTLDNGALRAVPGSHRRGRLPDAVSPDEKLLIGSAGDVIVMNAHMWHGGTANQTDRPRCAMHAFFCRRDKPQQQYQKALLRPETQQACSAELRALLALDDPLNDALAADPSPRSGFLK